MNLSGFEDIDPGVRAFILIVVAIAYLGSGLRALRKRPAVLREGVRCLEHLDSPAGCTAPDVKLLGYGLTVSEFLAYAACFPYVVYMAVSIAYPDLLRLTQRKAQVALASIIVGLVGSGFIAGTNHSHILTCEDFEISGHYVPANCSHPARP